MPDDLVIASTRSMEAATAPEHGPVRGALVAGFALDMLTALIVMAYGNSYLVRTLHSPSSYPAYAFAVYGVMKLVAAPDVVLEALIERAAALSQRELSAAVVAARAEAGAVADRQVLADERHAEAALRAVLLIESVHPPVRERLECVHRRIEHLLCERHAELDARS